MEAKLKEKADTLVNTAKLFSTTEYTSFKNDFHMIECSLDDWSFFVTIATVFITTNQLNSIEKDDVIKEDLISTITNNLISLLGTDAVPAFNDCSNFFEIEYNRLMDSDNNDNVVADAIGGWIGLNLLRRDLVEKNEYEFAITIGNSIVENQQDWWKISQNEIPLETDLIFKKVPFERSKKCLKNATTSEVPINPNISTKKIKYSPWKITWKDFCVCLILALVWGLFLLLSKKNVDINFRYLLRHFTKAFLEITIWGVIGVGIGGLFAGKREVNRKINRNFFALLIITLGLVLCEWNRKITEKKDHKSTDGYHYYNGGVTNQNDSKVGELHYQSNRKESEDLVSKPVSETTTSWLEIIIIIAFIVVGNILVAEIYMKKK